MSSAFLRTITFPPWIPSGDYPFSPILLFLLSRIPMLAYRRYAAQKNCKRASGLCDEGSRTHKNTLIFLAPLYPYTWLSIKTVFL